MWKFGGVEHLICTGWSLTSIKSTVLRKINLTMPWQRILPLPGTSLRPSDLRLFSNGQKNVPGLQPHISTWHGWVLPLLPEGFATCSLPWGVGVMGWFCTCVCVSACAHCCLSSCCGAQVRWETLFTRHIFGSGMRAVYEQCCLWVPRGSICREWSDPNAKLTLTAAPSFHR